MPLSVLICDDLEEDRGNLARMVERFGRSRGVEVGVETAASGGAVRALWQPRRWDVAFLDIYMPEQSGVEVARWLRERDRECALIFSTTSVDHGPVGYDLGVVDYLVKPFTQEDVDSALDWVSHLRAKDLRVLTVQVSWEKREIRLRDIQYIEIQGKVAHIHTTSGLVTTRRGMDALAEELAGDTRFFRCHRSYLVNLAFVESIQGRDFVMDSGERVPIGAANLTAAKWALVETDLAMSWDN